MLGEVHQCWSLWFFVVPVEIEYKATIALQHAARYIIVMDSCSLSITASPARLIAILSLGLLLRAART